MPEAVIEKGKKILESGQTGFKAQEPIVQEVKKTGPLERIVPVRVIEKKVDTEVKAEQELGRERLVQVKVEAKALTLTDVVKLGKTITQTLLSIPEIFAYNRAHLDSVLGYAGTVLWRARERDKTVGDLVEEQRLG